jgi:hypothetical protein
VIEMTDDIVTRLREYDFLRDGDIPDVIMNEAADEVELLRADRDRWRNTAAIMYEQVFRLKRLNEEQAEHVEKAMLSYGKAYNDG